MGRSGPWRDFDLHLGVARPGTGEVRMGMIGWYPVYSEHGGGHRYLVAEALIDGVSSLSRRLE